MKRSGLALAALIGGTWFAAPALAFVPSTLFSEAVGVWVTYLPRSHTFSFAYTLSNAPSSTQNIWLFAIRWGGASPPELNGPTGWDSHTRLGGESIAGWGGAVDTDEGVVPPGTSKAGFQMTDGDLPGIQDYYAKSDYIYSPRTYDEGLQIENQGLDFFPNNWKKGKTVGPSDTAPYSQPGPMLDYIASQKEEAFSLGWIDSQGIENSLDVKLDAASRAVERGNLKEAAHDLEAFAHEVAAQDGKHLNHSAVALLEANTEYARTLLP